MTDGCPAIDPRHAVIVAVKDGTPPAGTTPRIDLDLTRFQNGRWALQLDAAFARRETPAVILAQGVACLAVAWWAQLSPRSYMQAVRGAVFLSPLAIGFGQDGIAAAARLGPTTRLPFPSIVASAPYPFMEQLLALADQWGSQFVETAADPTAHPTNRHAALGSDAADLVALLPLLQGAAATGSAAPVLRVVDDTLTR